MSEHNPFFVHEYMHGQQNESHKALLSGFENLSREAGDRLERVLDISYGKHPRQRLDVFLAQRPCKGSILYFHAGYWQARDKEGFRFLATPFVQRGYNLALANYPLCPDVRLDELTDHAAEAVPFLAKYLAGRGGGGLILAGHSAGGHLACELALRAPAGNGGALSIRGILAVSGIYDLKPLVPTPLNIKLCLTEAEAEACSPIARVRRVDVPATFVVGGRETSEFRRQSREMAEAWTRAGNKASYIEVPGADHFSILPVLGELSLPGVPDAAG